ncbi:DUF393 domain-containing protein [Streptomyces sp. NPDC012751]|uniref:DUF393 domain-containing protein n=1 Tax=Streptomyces sp. NPDC012751 TaxID=3364846 RepID=UPI003683E331
MTAATATRSRDAAAVPVRGLTLLYDAESAPCAHLRGWLARRPRLVPLEPLPAGSAEASARFPGLDPRATGAEIIVVGDFGQVYLGPRAWIVLLWALREYRPLAHRLATPSGAKSARRAVLDAAKWREPPRRDPRWGGQVYRRADGWSYHPATGWSHEPPTSPGTAPATR